MTTGTDQTQTGDDIPVLYITPPHKKGMTSVRYMHHNSVIIKKGVKLRAVYPTATSTESENNKRQITKVDFICKQSKESNCQQA